MIPMYLLLFKLCYRYLIEFLKPWQGKEHCPQLINIETLTYRDIAQWMNFIIKYVVTEFLVDSLQGAFKYELPLHGITG